MADGSGETEKELRIALAMRGGVSLAVWIGGAMAEIDLARRAMLLDDLAHDPEGLLPAPGPELKRAEAYHARLRALGYRRLRVDVLAGASAGGLNAVIYGCAQSLGLTVDFLRDVWRREGDIWKLFHDRWSGQTSFRTEALFQGDDVFYVKLREALTQQPRGKERLSTDNVTVDLAATLQSGPPLPSKTSGGNLRPATAHFRFRHTPAPFGELNDIADATDDANGPLSLRRLAYAARATSSFPGAFEPARIRSHDVTQAPPEPPGSMHQVFSEVAPGSAGSSTQGERVFDVIDGGIFDNIPVGRAIEAVGLSPAGRLADRILIYLDPSPPALRTAEPPLPAFRKGRAALRATLVRTLLTTLRYKLTTEAVDDDMEELRRLALESGETLSRRDAFLSALSVTPHGDVDEVSYTTARQRFDVERVTSLLVRPGTGFLRSWVPQPAVACALTEAEAQRLSPHLAGAIGAAVGDEGRADPWELVSATVLLLAETRRRQLGGELLETGPEADRPRQMGLLKERLYRLQTVALLVAQGCDRAAVQHVLSTEESEPAWSALAVGAADRLLPEPTPIAAELDIENDDECWRQLHDSVLPAVKDGHVPQELYEALWQYAGDRFDQLWPEYKGIAGLEGAAALRREARHFLVATGPGTATTVPRYFSITGDEPPLVTLPEVELEGCAQAVDQWLGSSRPVADLVVDRLRERAVNADSKLAGNQLGNFAGFLLGEWRTHDWAWGRADAAAGLTRILDELAESADPEDEEQQGGNAWVDTGLSRSLDAVAAAAPADGLVEPDTSELNKPKRRLSDLEPPQRYALVMRISLALQRALWPVTWTSFRAEGAKHSYVRQAPVMAVLTALRPLLVLLPLVLRPDLLVVAATAVLASHHALGPREASLTVTLLGAALAAGVALACLVGTVRARTRLGDAAPALSGSPELAKLGAAVAGLRRSARVRVALLALFAALSVVLVVWARLSQHVDDGDPPWWRITTFDAVVASVVLVALSLRTRALSLVGWLSGRSRETDRRPMAIAAGFAVVLAAAVYVTNARWHEEEWWSIVLTSVTAAVLVYCVHHYWAGEWWPWVVALLGGAAVGGGQALALHFALFGYGGGKAAEGLWAAAAALLTPLAVLLAAIGAVWLARWASATDDEGARFEAGVAFGLLLMVVVAVGAVLAMFWAWPALRVVPLTLALGAGVCAATTLFAPYRDDVDPALAGGVANDTIPSSPV